MKKKIISFFVMVMMLLTVSTLTASAGEREILGSITSNYQTALSLAGRSSFHGKCNLATAYQLRAMGIYSGGLDYSGSGNTWYSHFKNVNRTSGGYNVITISGQNCLYDLVKKYGNEIYNVVYSLGTGGTSGSNHVLYIRAIINGKVYFADSFNNCYSGVYYPEGYGTVLSLSRFISAYRSMNGNAYGCVYFAKDDSADHYTGSSYDPDGWENSNREYITGEYIITASMVRVRKSSDSDSDSLGFLDDGDTVSVTAVRGKWGKISYEGKVGWICLDYALRLSSTTGSVSDTSCDGTPRSAAASLRSDYLSSDRAAGFIGTDVTWTAYSANENSKNFYSFYIYRDGVKVYSGTFSASNSMTYTLSKEGSYTASVTVIDEHNNSSILYSDNVVCVGEKHEHHAADKNGDGILSADESAFVKKIAANIDNITGKNFICNGIDKDGILSKEAEKNQKAPELKTE